MLSFEQARQIILENITPVGVEQADLVDAIGRVLVADAVAPWDMPLWDNSAMDGYAVRTADCGEIPCKLKVTGYIPAGARAAGIEVKAGCAVKIMTGAPVPVGADAVVPVEETEETSGEQVVLQAPVVVRQHIRYRGEDVRGGQAVIAAGTLIRPPEVSMLASFGRSRVPVFLRPIVAVLSTGDELIEVGRTPGEGELINSNTLALAAAVRESGGTPRIIGIARDNLESHREKLREGLKADMLVTSAGVSAGDRDLVRVVLEELGVKQVFWKVGIKPGKPTAFGVKDGKPVFSLPGNPVASLITFEEFVRPALLRMMGQRQVLRPTFRAILRDDVKNRESDRTTLLRIRLEREGDLFYAAPSGKQQTGLLKTMVNSAAIAVIAPGRSFMAAGEEVDVHFFGSYIDLI
ncbi:MAG: molybdopterin molybdotransferase MoeA [Desulfuromonadaceae bacterium]|nr:molybdopterin molybdotransferase MoeA [Desulfuromonadaceae bacterium]